MPYVKTNWMNNVTALNAANMNHIEQGIYDATNTAEAASSGKVDKVSTTGLEEGIREIAFIAASTNSEYSFFKATFNASNALP